MFHEKVINHKNTMFVLDSSKYWIAVQPKIKYFFPKQYLWVWIFFVCIKNIIKKGQSGALKLPHTHDPGMSPTIFNVLYAALSCFLHKRLFLRLESVTFLSHDNIISKHFFWEKPHKQTCSWLYLEVWDLIN